MNKNKFSLVIFAVIFSSTAFGQNAMQVNGIADFTLLILLSGIILLLLGVAYALAKSIEGVSKIPKQKKKGKSKAKEVAAILLLFFSSASYAGETNSNLSLSYTMTDGQFWTLISIILFLFLVIAVLFKTLSTMIRYTKGDSFEEETSEDLLKTLNLTDNIPLEKEVDIMLDHEYDGIRELDNNLPPWWKYLFYVTIIFAFVYLFRFHVSGSGKLQGEEYKIEMAAAEEEKAVLMANATESITEENVTYLIDAPSLEKGAAIYTGNCATCHGQLGEGGAGPNLTDEYWIHGGGIKNVFSTIKYGVPAKGMIAWQSQFSPSQMQKVASYVLSLQGTNPPNAKDPQGEIYVEENSETVADSSISLIDTTSAQ